MGPCTPGKRISWGPGISSSDSHVDISTLHHFPRRIVLWFCCFIRLRSAYCNMFTHCGGTSGNHLTLWHLSTKAGSSLWTSWRWRIANQGTLPELTQVNSYKYSLADLSQVEIMKIFINHQAPVCKNTHRNQLPASRFWALEHQLHELWNSNFQHCWVSVVRWTPKIAPLVSQSQADSKSSPGHGKDWRWAIGMAWYGSTWTFIGPICQWMIGRLHDPVIVPTKPNTRNNASESSA